MSVPRSRTRRTVIVGGPRTGKTTLAAALVGGRHTPILHTDDLIATHDWSAASQKIADDWLTAPGPWLIEGVAAVRGLRKWLRAHATGKPCDVVIVCEAPRVQRSPGQVSMAKGHAKIWREVEPLLHGRGVRVDVASGDK